MFAPFKDNIKLSIMMTCIFGFLVLNTSGERNYVLEFTKGNCYHNSTKIKTLECSLRNDSNNQTVIDGRLELSSVIQDVKIRAIVHINRKKMPQMTLFDMTVNGCEFLNAAHKHKLLSVYANTMKKYLNVMPQCPLSKDFNYTVIGFHYNMQDFPSYFPECDFKAIHILLFKNQEVAKLLFWGRVYLKDGKRG